MNKMSEKKIKEHKKKHSTIVLPPNRVYLTQQQPTQIIGSKTNSLQQKQHGEKDNIKMQQNATILILI